MSLSTRLMLVASIGFLAADVVGQASSSSQTRVDLAQVDAEYRLYLEHEHSWLCGTGLDATARSAPLAKGTPVYFQQDPPIITADYEGKATLQDFTVVGKVSKLTFDPFYLRHERESPERNLEAQADRFDRWRRSKRLRAGPRRCGA